MADFQDGPEGAEEPEDLEEHTVSWAELLAETQGRLEAAGDDNPIYCARLITEEASGYEGAEFIVAQTEPATVRGVAKLDAMVARRLAGEPIQYVIRHWPFRTLDLFVDRRVLIPRPETEVVAGAAIDLVLDMGAGALVADLGTGSGAVGLSIAAEIPETKVWLTDKSSEALDVARANLAGIGQGAQNVLISHGSWFEALPAEMQGQMDLIVSNPPYVSTTDELGPEVVDWEPSMALLAGTDGLDDLRIIVAESPRWLSKSGALVLEMAPWQIATVVGLCAQIFSDVKVIKDLAGLDRAVVARFPS